MSKTCSSHPIWCQLWALRVQAAIQHAMNRAGVELNTPVLAGIGFRHRAEQYWRSGYHSMHGRVLKRLAPHWQIPSSPSLRLVVTEMVTPSVAGICYTALNAMRTCSMSS
jgi:hypothetical protein